MSRIDELFQQLCPDGVEYRCIGDFAECYAGATPKTSVWEYWQNGTIPWMSSGEVNKRVIYNTEKRITQEAYNNCSTKMIPANSVVIALAGQGKTRGLVAITKIELCTNQSLCAIVSHKSMNSSFLYHFLRSQYQQLRSVSSGDGTRGGLNLQMIKVYSVPVPPLPVQEEIVRILDKFTALEAELETELEARRKQYEFYRDQLLTFGDEVEWKPLGEVCGDIENIRWTEVKNKVFCYIDLSSVDRDFHKITTVSEITNETAPSRAQQIVQINDILLGTTRPLLKRFCIIPEKYNGQICSTGYCVLRPIQTVVLPLWIYYQISLQRFYDYIEKYQKGASYPAISDSDVKRYKIPVPPLAEQERIVAILDKFDALVNDISSGLPAELEMRRKQYEYYRDRLLTFKPLAKEA